MGLASGRSQCGNGVGDPMLGQRYDVHVAFDHKQFWQFSQRVACLKQSVQFSALLKYFSLRRIKILGLLVTEDPTSKSNHPPAGVSDRKGNSLSEAIVNASRIIADE